MPSIMQEKHKILWKLEDLWVRTGPERCEHIEQRDDVLPSAVGYETVQIRASCQANLPHLLRKLQIHYRLDLIRVTALRSFIQS